MKILETERDSAKDIAEAIASVPAGADEELFARVRQIIADVRARGDDALIELGQRFDSPNLQEIAVTPDEFEQAKADVDDDLLQAIRTAKFNIEAFHRKQLQESWLSIKEDVILGQIVRPLDIVGIYAPGAQAPLPSTVLMTAVPARVAGVERIVMCSPAQADGKINAAMLVAAQECGITEVFKVGGAQAAAAMAFGTKTVPRVDKIVGPGNPYFVEAKRQLYGVVGIDQLAGPSEILIIADDTANPAFVAADILSQAEHAPDSRCALITDSRRFADQVIQQVKSRSASAQRKDAIQKAIDEHGLVIIARDLAECADLANKFAPEHLELAVAQPWELLPRIKNAGAIMLGHFTPVPLCDFAAGPNHTLPTGGTARFASPLGVEDFLKKSGLLAYGRDALEEIAPTVLRLAQAEGLDAHASAIRVRINK